LFATRDKAQQQAERTREKANSDITAEYKFSTVRIQQVMGDE